VIGHVTYFARPGGPSAVGSGPQVPRGLRQETGTGERLSSQQSTRDDLLLRQQKVAAPAECCRASRPESPASRRMQKRRSGAARLLLLVQSRRVSRAQRGARIPAKTQLCAGGVVGIEGANPARTMQLLDSF
jgi:hypothetical protein